MPTKVRHVQCSRARWHRSRARWPRGQQLRRWRQAPARRVRLWRKARAQCRSWRQKSLSSESNASRPRWPYHAIASRSTKSTACAACTHAESCAWVVPTNHSALWSTEVYSSDLGFGSITGCPHCVSEFEPAQERYDRGFPAQAHGQRRGAYALAKVALTVSARPSPLRLVAAAPVPSTVH